MKINLKLENLTDIILKDKKFSYLLITILFLMILTYFNYSIRIIDNIFLKDIYEKSNQYLKETNTVIWETFGVVSLLKGSVAVIEGSGFILQFGDFIQPMYDLIDITWELILASLVSVNIQKIILIFINDTKSVFFNKCLFVNLLVFLGIHIANKLKFKGKLLKLVVKLSKVMLIVIIFIWILYPYLIYYSGVISQQLVDEKIQEATKKLKITQKEIKYKVTKINEDIDNLEVGSMIGNTIIPWGKNKESKKLKESLKESMVLIKELLNRTKTYLFWVISSFFLKVIIIPLAILLAQYYLLKIVIDSFGYNIFVDIDDFLLKKEKFIENKLNDSNDIVNSFNIDENDSKRNM